MRNERSQRTASAAESVATEMPSSAGAAPICWNIDGWPVSAATWRLPTRSYTHAAPSVGSPSRKENSAADTACTPSSMPPAIVTIERDTPGQSASV